MPLWEFTPVAEPDDARWLDHRIYDRVVVAAPTLGDAIYAAAQFERRTAPDGVGNESVPFASGFEDEKLYTARRLDDEESAAYDLAEEGEPRIIDVEARD